MTDNSDPHPIPNLPIKKMLSTYQYADELATDLLICSSLAQPYLTFDRQTNKFTNSTDLDHQQDHHPSPPASAQPAESSPTSNLNAEPAVRCPPVLVYFIPGNPGLIEFYEAFVELLAESLHLALGGAEVVCSSHLGHSLRHNSNRDFRYLDNFKLWKSLPSLKLPTRRRSSDPKLAPGNLYEDGLDEQVEYHCHIVGKILSDGIGQQSQAKVIVIGHSVGGYLASKVIERYPDRVMYMVGLMPTLSHIARSTNGRRMAPLFSSVTLPFINLFQLIGCVVIPKALVYRLISAMYDPAMKKRNDATTFSTMIPAKYRRPMSEDDLLTLLNLVLNLNGITAVLKMARAEMSAIRDLDRAFIERFHRDFTLVWTSRGGDEWVAEEQISEIIDLLDRQQDPRPSAEHPQQDSSSNRNSSLDSSASQEDQSDGSSAPCDLKKKPKKPKKQKRKSQLLGIRPVAQAAQDPNKVPSWTRLDVGVPHAFCLKHNDILAKQCSDLIVKKYRLSL